MPKVSPKLVNYVVVLAVAVASISAYAALQPQVLASTAQGGQNAAARNQTVITNRVTIDKGTVLATITATGNLVPAQTSNLTFDASGIVRQILVKEGQHVEAGQTLGSVDDSSQQSAAEKAQP